MDRFDLVKILIVEDEPIIAEDIRDICELAGYSVPTVCYNYQQAMMALDKKIYDLALLDINLESEKSGLDISNIIKERNLNLPVIFLTSYSDKTTLQAAKNCNPVGYITKPFNQEQLICAIEIGLSNNKVKSSYETSKSEKLKTLLTSRELEIVSFICEGKSNEEIANHIYLSVNTVKFHIKNIYEKLDVNNRTQLLLLNSK